jgi:hypothetical protein
MESGNAWRMTQLLGQIVLKKLTPIIRFTDTSPFCVELKDGSKYSVGSNGYNP